MTRYPHLTKKYSKVYLLIIFYKIYLIIIFYEIKITPLNKKFQIKIA